MLICPLCSKKNIYPLREEKKIKIYQCLHCGVGFLDKISLRRQNKLFFINQYSLKDYLANKNRLKKRFKKLAKIILKFKNKESFWILGLVLVY